MKPFTSARIIRGSMFCHVLLAFFWMVPAQGEIRIPAFTSYFEPDLDSGRASHSPALSGAGPPALWMLWFGELFNPGRLECSVALRLPGPGECHLRLIVAGQTNTATAKSSGTEEQIVKFGSFDIAAPGYQRFALESVDGSGKPCGNLDALVLDGPPAQQARFNLKPRRNAASVHLMYPTPAQQDIVGFYCELTAVEDPLWTFYMACGWHRGYFGMQVNSPTERRIIFSVWDSGGERANRANVDAENRVTLAGKGTGVFSGDFGNEGTGGHSHWVYPWRTGQKQRFLVTARPTDETHTVYSGYFFLPDEKKWKLISSWKAPKDGGFLRKLHSFSENFNGDNGHLPRKALYGNQWIQTADSQWHELNVARFSHDQTGRADRFDRFMGVEKGEFFLSHGGFVPGFSRFGEEFSRPAHGNPPLGIVLPSASQ
jgi:hypothetical protein